MEPSPQESAPSRRKRVFEELVRCQGYAKQLEDIVAALGNNPDSEGDLITRDLVKKVRSSIDNSLSELSHEEFEEVSQVVMVARRPMKRGQPNASDDSEGSVRSSLPTPRDRRGCYKRRSNGESWTEVTPSMSADDHQWRKYGQKSILNAAHPRNYFRCTHKSDQGCMATKQVQKISDDPIKFRTVYQCRHTCMNNRRLKSTEIVSDNDGSNNPGNGGSSVLISFESTISSPFNIFDPRGDISIKSSDPGDVVSSGHQGGYLDMVMSWDDTADFLLDCGSAGDI